MIEARLARAELDGVLPDDFHSTTNFPSFVGIEGQWVPVERIEMDCGIRVWQDGGVWRAETCPMHQVRTGDLLVVVDHLLEGVVAHVENFVEF